MQQFRSPFLKEFSERGFISQITHPKELDELMNSVKISFYIGFDCTAKSLHIGSLMQIIILRTLQMHGHQPIVLLGGGTTKIGDPSGKDESRQFLDETQIVQNLIGIKTTLEKFDLSKQGIDCPAFKFVNNDDWLKDLSYIEFLRDVGKHFSVNKMLTFESVKLRLDRQQPLSFLEFNYIILQSYDFYELNKKHNCVLQIGGSDQWGNIVSGVDLTRRISASNNKKLTEVFGLTTPLLTNADGKKMGKTAAGAIWLDETMLNPFDYYQYFRNVDDKDVEKFLRFSTDLTPEVIAEIIKKDINVQKEILARQATEFCHGYNKGRMAEEQAKNMFSNIVVDVEALPIKIIYYKNEIEKKLFEILKQTDICESNGEAKKLIKGGGIKIDDKKIIDENYLMQINQKKLFFKLSVGKKKLFKIQFRSN
jgi:tyrosyl-tRNA synthetase